MNRPRTREIAVLAKQTVKLACPINTEIGIAAMAATAEQKPARTAKDGVIADASLRPTRPTNAAPR